jgi:hypothetical protein
MRIYLDNNNVSLTLSAEIAKRLGNFGNSFPDMVLHNDSNNDNNNITNQYLVMEVKNINQSNNNIEKDFNKIHDYMNPRNLNYENGVVVLYSKNNTTRAVFQNKINNILYNNRNNSLRARFDNIITNKNLYFVLVNAQDNNQNSNVSIYKFQYNSLDINFVDNYNIR